MTFGSSGSGSVAGDRVAKLDYAPDLDGALAAVQIGESVVESAVKLLASGDVDGQQVLAYDIAHSASALRAARSMLSYGRHGDDEAMLTCIFVADVLGDLAGRTAGRSGIWGCDEAWVAPVAGFFGKFRDPALLAQSCGEQGSRRLSSEFEMVRDTFHRFAENRLRPVAEHIHRANTDIPEDLITDLGAMGAFGLSVPEEFGGFDAGDGSGFLAMVVATEELSWGSLGAGGSLVTRPEILGRALMAGGTDEQKKTWLPQLASGQIMNAVAVTEPDFGSDVASVTTAAVPHADGWLISGVKTWCTFAARADVLMVLARSEPDRALGHRGLSMFIVPKSRVDGHGFVLEQDPALGVGTGRIEGRPIDTLGYRGMHSYELAFDNWFVPADHLIGGEEGRGKGFYFQMAGFENGRVQTAARALGVMQAAYEAALSYASDRKVFGRAVLDYELTRNKLTRMAALIQACRQFAYEVTDLMGAGGGTLEASMVKAYACRAAEWVTREAMQIHGGMGYAEEFPVSRLFVDARVLSIFEGADETLALKVIAKGLVELNAVRAGDS